MRHRELWTLIVETLDGYHTMTITPVAPGKLLPSAEEYVDDTIRQQFGISSDETSFVRECFLGVLRYDHVCEGILQGFCDALKRNKQDRYSMYLIAYLFVYRFSEVSGRFLRSLMDKCTSATRLAEYVGFLLDEAKMTQFAAPALRQWFDDGYIENFIIGNLQKHREEADRDVLQYYLAKATNPVAQQVVSDDEMDEMDALSGGQCDRMQATSVTSPSRRSVGSKAGSVKSSKAPTVAKAPNLSQSGTRQRDLALRRVPSQEVRDMLATVVPPKPPKVEVPPNGVIPLDGPRPEKDPLASPRKDFPFVETERPTHRQRLLEEKKAREDALYQPDPMMQTRLLPEEVRDKFAKLQSSAPTVKQTTASIRREELLYRRRDDQKEQELLRKAQEMRDDSEYQEWRQKQDDAARIERETRITERKLEMMLADEEAKMARVRHERHNATIAREFRRTMTAWRDANAVEESAERQRKSNFATQLRQEVQEQTEVALRQVKQEKKSIAQSVKVESHQNELKTAAAMELERQRKSALIAEIRTLQEQSIKLRPQAIERCRDARLLELGVMGTMSIDELKQKLAEVSQEHTELEQQRRSTFISHRTNQRKELDQMAARCEWERQQYLDLKEKEREAKREQAASQAEQLRVVEEARLIELQAKLQKTRDERKQANDRRKEEERQRKVEAMLLAGDAGAMEMKKWGEMERGVDNRILRQQNAGVRELKRDRTKSAMLVQQREANIAKERSKHQTARERSDETLKSKKIVAEQEMAYDDDYKRSAIDAMREERAAMRTRTA